MGELTSLVTLCELGDEGVDPRGAGDLPVSRVRFPVVGVEARALPCQAL